MGKGLLLLFALAAGASAQDLKRHESPDGNFSITLPAAWTADNSASPKAVLAYDVHVPGVTHSLDITVWSVDGVGLTARNQAYRELDAQIELWKGTKGYFRPTPIPHVEIHHKRGAQDRVVLITFTRQLCRGVNTQFICSKKAYRTLRPQLLTAGASVTSKLGRWPRPPLEEGYRRYEKDGMVFLSHADVDSKDRKKLQRELLDLQKRFVKVHGKVPREEPLIVYIHNGRVEIKHLSPDTKLSGVGHGHDRFARILFAAPWKDDNGHRLLLYEAWMLHYAEVYGVMVPDWARVGEWRLIRFELLCGKPAPNVPTAWFMRFKGLKRNLDGVDALREDDWEGLLDDASGYLVFLTKGPSKYRKAYRAFLKHIRETGDVKDAWRHLHAIGLDEIREAAQKYLDKKLKPID